MTMLNSTLVNLNDFMIPVFRDGLEIVYNGQNSSDPFWSRISTQFNGKVLDGEKYEMRVRRSNADSVTTSPDALSDFPGGRESGSGKVSIRLDARTFDTNDVTTFNVVGQTTLEDLNAAEGNEGRLTDIGADVLEQMQMGYDRTGTRLAYSPQDGQLGLVNGTKVNNDGNSIAASTSYTSGASSCRFYVDNCQITLFEDGDNLDIYDSSGNLLADSVEVYGVNITDPSIGVRLTSFSTVANMDNVADNAVLYIRSSRNAGFKGSIYNHVVNASTNAAYLGGVDRSSPAYSWLNPIKFSAGSATLSTGIVMTAASYLAHRNSATTTGTFAFVTSAYNSAAVAAAMAAQGIRSIPASGEQGTIADGALKTVVLTPHLPSGRVEIIGSRYMPDTWGFLGRVEDWEMYWVRYRGMKMVPGEIGGVWHSVPGVLPNTSSKRVIARATANMVMTHKAPRDMVAVTGLVRSN